MSRPFDPAPARGAVRRIEPLIMAVYRDPILEYSAQRLGNTIREHRKRRALTLQQLASGLDISIATLSSIETGKIALDIDRLMALAASLDVPVRELLPATRDSPALITRAGSLRRRRGAALRVVRNGNGTPGAYHNVLRPLAEAFVGKKIAPFHIEVLPTRGGDRPLLSHHHEEFFFVRRGEVACVLQTPAGTGQHTLRAGDCMYFWSYLPHCIHRRGAERAETIHVLHGISEPEREDASLAFSEGTAATVNQQVVSKIRALRLDRSLSVVEFAREMGIGTHKMSEIERGRRSVPLDVLLRVCAKFRKPLEYFLTGPPARPPYFVVQRAREIRSLPVRRRRNEIGGTFRSLAAGFRDRGMHPYYVELPPQPLADVKLHEHHGQEFVYVISGEATFVTIQDGERVFETLLPGDTCFLDSTVPHAVVGGGASPYGTGCTELIDVFWCPLGEEYLFA